MKWMEICWFPNGYVKCYILIVIPWVYLLFHVFTNQHYITVHNLYKHYNNSSRQCHQILTLSFNQHSLVECCACFKQCKSQPSKVIFCVKFCLEQLHVIVVALAPEVVRACSGSIIKEWMQCLIMMLYLNIQYC
jgi:hypothetical protein